MHGKEFNAFFLTIFLRKTRTWECWISSIHHLRSGKRKEEGCSLDQETSKELTESGLYRRETNTGNGTSG